MPPSVDDGGAGGRAVSLDGAVRVLPRVGRDPLRTSDGDPGVAGGGDADRRHIDRPAGHLRDQGVRFAALGFTLLTIAIALQFQGPAVTVGWAAEGAVVVALGLRERRDWLRAAGALLFGIALIRAVLLILGTPIYGEVL